MSLNQHITMIIIRKKNCTDVKFSRHLNIRFLSVFYICHALLFDEWLTVMATHIIFGKDSVEHSFKNLPFGSWCRTDYKFFNGLIGTLDASRSMVSKKSNSHLVTNYPRALQNTW